MATNVAPNGQKPMWILPENTTTTGGVVITSSHPVQLAGKPLFVKEEYDDPIIFTKVKDSDIVVPTLSVSNEGKNRNIGVKQIRNTIKGHFRLYICLYLYVILLTAFGSCFYQ